MWAARTKDELIIEVWEKLDCDSVGAAEVEAIEVVLNEQFGPGAVDSPMEIARVVADEGAELRHSELMELWVARATDRPYDAALRNVLDVSEMRSALRSIRSLDNLKKKYGASGDKEGVRLVRDIAIRGRDLARETAERRQVDVLSRQINTEIAEWFALWLQSSAAFDSWIKLRLSSSDFRTRFGDVPDV
ncbi:MAG: hypothetical protein JO053_08355 [Acidobacteria bacterium]|nr:hypothetical protein [Acidobacteriota bacterium]